MSRFLRTSSTRRLLGVIGGLIAVIAAGTAIAVAAAGNGPVPKPKPLATALRDALGGKQVQGISAHITFTNHLIDASSIQGATDPLLQGGTGRLWLSPSQHRLRLELQSDNGDAQIVVDNGTFSVYDPSSKTAYQGTLPQHSGHTAKSVSDTLPSLADIQKELGRLAQHLSISGAIPSDVAGQPAYTVRVSPKHDGGLLGAAELGWDATHGVPLRFAIYARGSSSPVIELKATDISFGPVSPGVFTASPPPGTKIVKVAPQSAQHDAPSAGRHHGHRAEATGAAAVARRLPFTLVAPSSLVGLRQAGVTLLDWNHSPAALVSYGKGLGGIAVIEQRADGKSASTPASSGNSQFSLPTVSIKGATGTELDTALGTVIRFTRAGVAYTLLGSVPPSAAELAARAL